MGQHATDNTGCPADHRATRGSGTAQGADRWWIYRRLTRRIAIGGVSVSPFAGPIWIVRTTSMPRTTRPNAAKPCPSGWRAPAEIERRLIADADRERVTGRVGGRAGHRQRAILVREAGDVRSLERNCRQEIAHARSRLAGRLDDRDLDRLVDLVVGTHRAEEPAAIEESRIDVLQKVGGGDGRPRRYRSRLRSPPPRSR